ncbi:hypothetical protein GF359_08285 [candidate division WOR-3 bacterium]|uniref:Uncharacterized protein n=1 Tax=candidate division WOR-3 bacterium TaxID=2052148 RepID=A0A9D5KAJ8_UNCW3|nr:hypothetical protein [candidate division WOR-3 bacterium]MBD3365199.1 hypothetical protein [candidate division WOR-3 bacterium]
MYMNKAIAFIKERFEAGDAGNPESKASCAGFFPLICLKVREILSLHLWTGGLFVV